jgi:hypothetical protein
MDASIAYNPAYITSNPELFPGNGTYGYTLLIQGSRLIDKGNVIFQRNRSLQNSYPVSGDHGISQVPNCIQVSLRQPAYFEDATFLSHAAYSVKEELARYVEQGVLIVNIGGVAQTATQIRALLWLSLNQDRKFILEIQKSKSQYLQVDTL